MGTDDEWADVDPKRLLARINELEEQLREAQGILRELDNDGRMAFIRDTALRLFVIDAVNGAPKPDEAWRFARALWEAKPEDC